MCVKTMKYCDISLMNDNFISLFLYDYNYRFSEASSEAPSMTNHGNDVLSNKVLDICG